VITLKYSEIIARNRELGATLSGDPYRIVILSNVVMSQLREILEYVLRRKGIRAEVTLGEYDNIVQDSIRLRKTDAIVIFWEVFNLVDNLHARANALGETELSALLQRVEQDLALVTANLKQVPLVVFNRFSALLFENDTLKSGALGELCGHLNATVERLATPNLIVVDINKIFAIFGVEASADYRQFQSSKAPYSVKFLKAYSEHVEPAFLAATGRGGKVLVLDCDNTIWGGILGEDGEDQIQLSSETSAGRVFREIQFILQGYKKQGILLAICSKNNPEDVDRVLKDHPTMVLRDADFVAKKVNWRDKATNLRELAVELNLGLDSFVFVDDSKFELGLVQQELPEIRCFRVPDNLSEYPSLMRRIGREFFALARTEEDVAKTEMYHQEFARKSAVTQHGSLEDYLRSLGLVVQVCWGNAVPVPRAAQLSQKTNQFNLTTRRYTESDIQRMIEDKNYLVGTVAVADHYGGYGVTGLVILRLELMGVTAVFDTLLLSCRVMGRNVEFAFFDYLAGKLKSEGVAELRGKYIRTTKNDVVSRYFDAVGFSPMAENDREREYALTLGSYVSKAVEYIKVTESG